jgi:hypothetical protein
MPAPIDLKEKVSKCQRGQQGQHESSRDSNGQQRVSTMSAERTRNIALEIRAWVEAEPGKFHTSEIDRELRLTTRAEQNARAKTLERLRKIGVIERAGAVRGYYQLIDNACPEIDFLNQTTSNFPLSLPFGLDEMVRIMPGNIIVIAGSPNAGKTALLLNTIFKNNARYADRLHYFTSECASELRTRLELFEGMGLHEWKFKAYERSHNFHQVIKPNDVNIIDYLELHSDFYAVGGLLAEIHRALRDGVAIVALQKNRDAKRGLGGERSTEKARLYLTVDANPPNGNTVRIEKAKSYISENPNGKELDFKLIGGWRLFPMTGWRHVAR